MENISRQSSLIVEILFGLSQFADHEMKRLNFMKASEFDEKFDNGENIFPELELSRVRRPGEETKRINVDFHAWMVVMLDREARQLGVTRQSVIKMWLTERLQPQNQ